jgi:hypothetical protein
MGAARRPREAEHTRRGQASPYWLLVRHNTGGMEVLTRKTVSGEVVVPVFGSEKEARAFLSKRSGSWSARKTGGGELVSILSGICREARWVALDPLPQMATEEAVGLVGVRKECFVEPLLGRGRSWFEEAHQRERLRAPTEDARSRVAGEPTAVTEIAG